MNWEHDERLKQRVTIQAEGVPLAELLPLLSEKTGVTITTGREVADEKVIVFSRSRPLRATLNDLAALFRYGWQERKDASGKPAYRLERLPRTRRFEDELDAEDQNWILKKLDALVQASRETPEQLKRRSADDPARRLVESPEGRLAVELYARLTPDQQAVMTQTDRVRLPVSSLTPAQKAALAPLFYKGDVFKENPELVKNDNGGFSLNGITPIGPEKMDRTSLSFEQMVSASDTSRGTIQVYMRAPTGLTTALATFPAPDAFALPPHGDPYDGTPVDAKNVPTIAANGASLVDRLKALAEKSGRPVFADFYRSRPIHVGTLAEVDTDTPTGKLDALCVGDGYLWWTRGDTLLFRKRDWYRQKRFEVSDAWRKAAIRQLSARDGKYLAADLFPLAQLTLEQLVGLQESKFGDRRNLGGLPQALQMIVAVTPPDTPLWGEPQGKTLVSRTLLTPPTDARVGSLLPAFIDRYNYPDTLLDVKPQHFGFLVNGETMKGDAEMQRSARFFIDVQTEVGSRAIGYRVAVPLVLPGDRSTATQISVP